MSTYVEKFTVLVVREKFTDRLVSVRYEDEDKLLHRTFGEPAYEAFDPATGRLRQRVYAEHNEEHRLGGKPCFQEIDPVSGIMRVERWSERNLPPENGVSMVARDEYGQIISVVRRENGRQIVEDFDTANELDSNDPQP